VTRSRSQITESQSAVSALERDGGRLQLPFHPRRPWQPQERPQVIRIRGGWTCWQKPHGFEPPHVAESKSGALPLGYAPSCDGIVCARGAGP
jgi:hypothetical protein